MKKTYQNPTTMVVKIHTVQMIAAGSVEGFNRSLNSTGDDGGKALGRRYNSSWDDEDEY